MGFDEAKRLVAKALRERRFRHERRAGTEKNLLELGEITIEDALRLVESTRGNQAASSPHHFDPKVTVWVFKPQGWYIKFYVVDLCWFISFHRSEVKE